VQLTLSASVSEFDNKKYMTAVRAEFRRVFLKAAQKFLLAAIPKIPIWTGMARGAFRNLEDIAGKVTNDAQSPTGVRIRTTTGRGSRRGGGAATGKRQGYYYTPPGGARIERTPEAGRQFATSGKDILDVSGATLATGRHAFYFRFAVNITYFNTFDTSKWGSFKAGSDAFEEYVKANVVLPNPLEFMTRKIIKN